jgi:hypothetical protein
VSRIVRISVFLACVLVTLFFLVDSIRAFPA